MACAKALAALSLLSLSLGSFSPFCYAQQEPSAQRLQTVKFEPSDKPLVNPGKGWVVYGKSPKGRSKEALEVCSLAYERFNWSQVEPEEGAFNWTPIDDAIDAWAAAGKQFSFGVMCESFHSSVKYNTPKWVFDAGAPAIEYDGWKVKGQVALENWENPVFLEKLKNFIDAMGKRYDGDPRVAFIDIRSYGQWGEGHLEYLKGSKEISLDGMKRHIQIHLDAFRKTRLLLPWGVKRLDPVYEWAIDNGVGLRRDGILWHSDGSELVRCKGKAPAYGEWSCRDVKAKDWRLAWGEGLEGKILDDTTRGVFTYQNLAQSDISDVFVKEMRPFVDKLTNMMGYHFVLMEASFPNSANSGANFEASMLWSNKGLAPIYIPCRVEAALLGDDGKLAARSPAIGSQPSGWLPGQEAREKISLKFDVPKGSYRLALGLFSGAKGDSPDVKLGMESDCVGGWHVLGRLSID